MGGGCPYDKDYGMLRSILGSHDFRKTAKCVRIGSGASAGTSFGSGFPCKAKARAWFLHFLAECMFATGTIQPGNALVDLGILEQS